ncbi:long tail fiber distal subunit [Escherichia phage vb_EcoM-VR5]|uniref:Long tail fiber protein Gp37 n=1 Tax=Escherichia phage vb_EcoM-VR5 TaxID=1567026 RepID=A0A0A7HBH2_9CAUD|nr:long tail fiber protein distal subunit [Escherichia phage vb_EcoM-VR5]AIZ02037.1 long tail fiber distal subunit [Escherichia phage vb_EcoM-VR5]
MATLKQIQFKRSKVAGVRPTPAQLAEGELAINLKDRLLFTKDDSGAIIDLGFAKGGNIDGNVIHKGNYNQTGNYTLNGTFTQTGNYTTTGSVTANGDVTAKSRLMTDNGEVLVRGAGTAHVRFQDLADARERGIIYSQSRPGNTKQILNVRVQDYTNSTSNIFAFNGDGLFYAPSISGGTSIKSPVIYTNTVDTGNKSALDYDISSLANNNSNTDKNNLRVVRTDATAAMLHEICENNGISWYSGSTPTDYILSFAYSGGFQAGHSIAVGMESGPMTYSALGKGSIALGDNDTGLKWHQDGYFHTVNNGTRTFIYGPEETASLRKMVIGYSVNGTDLTTPPTENYALGTVVTYHDNNAFGDGQTLLGYYQGGAYHHYFRGKGTTNINTAGGLLVTPGNIDVIGGLINIDGRSNASTLLFSSYTSGQSSVDNMNIRVWGDTFATVGGTRKNVMEISDATSWMHYIQRTTAGKVESYLNGAMNIVEGLSVGQDASLKRNLYVSNEIKVRGSSGLRIWNDKYGVIFRNSEDQLHIIPTNINAGESGGLGPLRPLSITLDTGRVKIPNLEADQVYFRGNGALEFPNSNGASYANQNTTKALLYQTLDAATQAFYPITKQKNIDSNVTVTQGMDRATSEYRIVAQGDLLGDGDATGLKYWRFTKEGNFITQNHLYAGTAFLDTEGNISGSIWNKYSGATNLDAAVNTRVGKSGDTMTGKLTIEAPGDALVLRTTTGNSSHIRSDVNGTGNWYVGKGGDDNGIALYSYATNSGMYITNSGAFNVELSGSGLAMQMNYYRMYVNGRQWVASQGHGYGNQWQTEAPYFVDFGEAVPKDSYMPIIKGRSTLITDGYSTKADFGIIRSAGASTWGSAVIRVGSAESGDASHPNAIYVFGADGTLTAPNAVNAASRMGVGTSCSLPNASIAIGDNDTGLSTRGDGSLGAYANAQSVFFWEAGGITTEQNKFLNVNAGMYVRDNIDVNDVYIRSDIRCKSEIKLIENAQEKSKLLGGYTYLLKNSVTDEVKPSAGLIAQEVQEVLPELVSEDKETGLLRLNYNGIIGLNTATINEHTDEIKELKSEIAELKALIKSLL